MLTEEVRSDTAAGTREQGRRAQADSRGEGEKRRRKAHLSLFVARAGTCLGTEVTVTSVAWGTLLILLDT